ncbi:hypothetical protein EZJ19_05935 [Parasulfuritortus cantonensis]|uniref:HD-GYP domain-containing protein n=1 Tax=Parasulfuritortus cantonensis TaxID=2528202 RepID=A0A4R1BFE8_9PROT|nr:HD domain-containing phosphohydrolase [Parasulfuritortus cantonensis]TCJ15758.1 hypothetical protein EZJ19_05935 [Parasulfuritortus cantonensis]
MARKLIPVDCRYLDFEMALPFDLFNESGVLVLAQGGRLADQTRLARLLEMRLYCYDAGPEERERPPSLLLGDLAKRFVHVSAPGKRLNPREYVAISDELLDLMAAHPDMCTGMLLHLDVGSYSRRHALFVAALSYRVAEQMGVGRQARRTLIRAALTMNVASFSLQDNLAEVSRPLTGAEKTVLAHHPRRATELLAKAGVTDVDWLRAVLQHHENLDQSGYPYQVGAEALGLEARILRAVDVFAAMLSQRPTRLPYVPGHAVRVAFERERGHLDDAVMLILRRLLGKYPPGTLVKLANRETAVITRWFKSAETPKYVVSLMWPSGHPMQQPHARKTSHFGCGIREHTSLPLAGVKLDWPRIWAEG